MLKLEITNPEACGRMGIIAFRRAFDVAVREYKIGDIDGTVKLTFKPFRLQELMVSHTKKGINVQTAGVSGETYSRVLPGNVSLVRIMPAPSMSMQDVMQTWLHEMKHVAQHLKGEFVANEDDDHITWMGSIMTDVQVRKIGYDNFPWEKDAREAAEKLIPVVMQDLDDYAQTPEGKRQFKLARVELLGELLRGAGVYEGHA